MTALPRLATVVAASGLSALAAVAAEAAAAPRIRFEVGVALRPDAAALVLALHRGCFARLGLSVELIAGTSTQEFVPALARNHIQMTSGTPGPAKNTPEESQARTI